jgi:hypothetical protein
MRFLIIAALLAATSASVAAEIPKEFRGTWCTGNDTFKKNGGHSGMGYNVEGASECQDNLVSVVEITATGLKSPALSLSCTVREVTQFDVCPWGMIFHNRERARALRPFQINPWSPGYHVVLQCSSPDGPETVATDWVIEKGYIVIGDTRAYRCPWNKTLPTTGVRAR